METKSKLAYSSAYKEIVPWASIHVARLANNLVDMKLLRQEILEKYRDRLFSLKLIVMDALDSLQKEVRFIDEPMGCDETDYEFRRTMILDCKDKERGNKLLRRIALQFYGPNYEYYQSGMKISLDSEATKELFTLFFLNDARSIIEKYNLISTCDLEKE